MVERCSVDESGTKMQQIYAATTFTTTKTYNIELKVHRISPKLIHSIGILLLGFVCAHAAADAAVVQWCDVIQCRLKTSSDLNLKSWISSC